MANTERGEQRLVTTTGQEYVLRLTTNACCELEDRTGKLFDDVMAQVHKGSLSAVRWMLWASLQDKHGATIKTVSDAGNLIDACGGIMGVGVQLAKFLTLNADDDQAAESEGAANPPSAEAVSGTGSVSMPADSASPTSSSGRSRSASSGGNSTRLGRTTKPNGGGISTSPG